MSSSIPVPHRKPSRPSLSLSDPTSFPCASSLPARTGLLHSPAPHPQPSPSIPNHHLDALNLSTSAPSLELISRTARRWRSDRNRPLPFWDFSEVGNATDQVANAFAQGAAFTMRPPREGLSGTYFFCRNDDSPDKLAVFKPMDEEALNQDMSPPPSAHNPTAPLTPLFDSSSADFFLGPPSLGPGPPSPPISSPPPHSLFCPKPTSISSESDNGSSRTAPVQGFHPGEGAYREVAAYLLDHDRFAGVPQTALVQWLNPNSDPGDSPPSSAMSSSSTSAGLAPLSLDSSYNDAHPGSPPATAPPVSSSDLNFATKKGAFQVYIPNIGDADDFGPGVFDKDQVHRIAVLDIRTLNHDRHGGNLLVRKCTSTPSRRYDLVPIDHGYILPDAVQAIPWPVWMDWPMIRQPVSDDVKRYILYLDAETEARRLNEELSGVFRSGALQALKIATLLLQKGISAGLTLYDIGLLMYTRREDLGERTELEKIVTEAEEASHSRDYNMASKLASRAPRMPDDPHHRRHQSMNAIEVHEHFEDEYVVKYACRRIQELVSQVAAAKVSAREKRRNAMLCRARSIPDFGIGIKPVHVLHDRMASNREGGDVPAPTPAASPKARSRGPMCNIGMNGIMPTLPPIQVPIGDDQVGSITSLGQNGFFGAESVTIGLKEANGSNGVKGAPPISFSGGKSRFSPNMRTGNGTIGTIGTAPAAPLAAVPATAGIPTMDNGLNGLGMHRDLKGLEAVRLNSGGLPPTAPKLQETKRKASPVSAMEMYKWEASSQP